MARPRRPGPAWEEAAAAEALASSRLLASPLLTCTTTPEAAMVHDTDQRTLPAGHDCLTQAAHSAVQNPSHYSRAEQRQQKTADHLEAKDCEDERVASVIAERIARPQQPFLN